MLLGKKSSGEAYTTEDLRLLESLSIQLSLALVNAELHNKIKEHNKTLNQKVEEQTMHIKDLNKVKADFLDIVSHQLRTPLTRLRGYRDLYKDTDDLEKQKEYIEKLFENIENFEHIIHPMLEITELKGGFQNSLFKTFNLVSIVTTITDKYRKIAQEKNLIFHLKAPQKLTITAQEGFIQSAIEKLISNAVTYTQKGAITIGIALDRSDTVSISIQDTGIGLSKEDKSVLFIPFKKGKRTKNIDVNTSGVSLFIVNQIVKRHHGSIIFKSKGVNKGSTFTLTIPRIPSS
ncbi:MAG: HAMP domain-containing histidine kinase [bacterium]|nr:HAMP domain-containing histidine kinase [bacterium]